MKIFFASVCTILFLAWHSAAGAQEIRQVVLNGNTVDIGLEEITGGVRVSKSQVDLESLAVAITDRYHQRGYTTSHVEKMTIRKDGILEIAIRESKIAGVAVSGISGAAAARLRELIAPVQGEVYNRDIVRERAMTARRLLHLSRIKISAVNHEGSADVLLRVETGESVSGRIGGGMYYEPIYGMAPAIIYEQEIDSFGFSFRGEAGYREGDFRKLEAGTRIYTLLNRTWSLFADYEFQQRRETWQLEQQEYNDISHIPSAGVRAKLDGFVADMALGKSYISLEGYGEHPSEQSDTHLNFFASYFDGMRRINIDEGTGIALSLTAGYGSIIGKSYLRGEWKAHTTWSPLIWLKVRPRVLAGHTTANERYYWWYVFDKNLAGFSDDFTATKTRFVTGADLELEAYPETLYLGPFVNSGRFLDESDAWRTKTGGGAAARVHLGGFSFIVRYAWDLSGSVLNGGVIFSAEGTL